MGGCRHIQAAEGELDKYIAADTDPNNYAKLYDYTKISVEFYIANTSHRQGLHPRGLLPSPS